MKLQFLLLLLGIALVSCQKEVEPELCSGPVKIKFHNATDFIITEIKIDGNEIPAIRPGDSSYFHCFDEFGLDTGMPDCKMTGVVEGKPMGSTSQFYWCGTEKSKLEPGTYEMEINIVKWGRDDYFHISFTR